MEMQQIAGNVAIVRRALYAFYQPNATEQIIKHNENILQEFKNSLNPQSALTAASIIFDPLLQAQSVPDFETNYAFQLITERILQIPPWLAHNQHLRATLRQLAINLVLKISPNHSRMVQEKVAHLLVSLAVREWPQLWPNFLDDLLTNAPPPQMVCIVLRLLSEEVHQFGTSIAISRKRELSKALLAGVSKMLSFVSTCMDTFVNANNPSGMRSAIGVIEAFVAWVPVDTLFEMRIPNACINFLTHPDCALSALSALEVMFNRIDFMAETGYHLGYRNEVFPSIMTYSLSHMKHLQSISYAPPMGVTPNTSEAFHHSSFQENGAQLQDIETEMHQYTLKFVTMLAKMGTAAFIPSYIVPCSSGTLDQVEQQTATVYIDTMLSTIASPSLQIRHAGIVFFTFLMKFLHRSQAPFFKNSKRITPEGAKPRIPREMLLKVVQSSFMREVLNRLASIASLALIKWPYDPLLQAFEEEDFNGDSGLANEQWIEFRRLATQLIFLAAKFEPLSIMQVTLERFVNLLGTANYVKWTSTQTRPRQNGAVSVANGKLPFVSRFILLVDPPLSWSFGSFNQFQSEFIVAALDGTVLATESVVMNLQLDSNSVSQSLQMGVENLFQIVTNLAQPNLQVVKALSLRIFIRLYNTNKDALEKCFKCLIEIAESSKNSELCFRACSSLAAICRRLCRGKSATLKEFVLPLRDFALRVQGNTNYARFERYLVMDSAISATLLVDNVADQAKLVESLINPIMTQLDSTGMTSNSGDPQRLYEFLESAQCEVALTCLSTTAKTMTHITEASEVPTEVASITTSLTPSIAPSTATFAALLVTSLHAMYNPNVFPLSEPKRRSVLEPTSREVASLLNLSDEKELTLWSKSLSGVSIEAGEESTEMESKSALERADDVLARLGIRIPDPQYGELRENLKKVRLHAYDVMKSTILSGVTGSATHLGEMLNAICSNKQYLEPIHVNYLVHAVIEPLLSYKVMQANAEYLTMVASSEIPAFIELVRVMVEQSNSESTSSTLFAVEVSRDHGRKFLATTSADMLAAMFRRPRKITSEYIPPVFNHPALFRSLNALWDTLCNVQVVDNTSAAAALRLVSQAVYMAPSSAKQIYASKLTVCLETAFRMDGAKSDTANGAAQGSVLSFLKKWPQETCGVIMNMISGQPDDLKQLISKNLKELTDLVGKRGNNKMVWSKLRGVIRTLAAKAGFSARKEVDVDNLPTNGQLAQKRGIGNGGPDNNFGGLA